MLIYLIVISKRAYWGIISITYMFRLRFMSTPLCRRWWGEGCFNKCPFPYHFLYANSTPYMKKGVSSENFPRKFRPQKMDSPISQTPS